MNEDYQELAKDTGTSLRELEKLPWIEFISIMDSVISNRIKQNKVKKKHGR